MTKKKDSIVTQTIPRTEEEPVDASDQIKSSGMRSKKGQEVSPTRKGNFPIVGIGASAGGLKAFEAFFSGMPTAAAPSMAFVLVQHLAPNHTSILRDLVQRFTPLQVFEVEDGVAVKPNRVYIIPPNCDLAILNGTLQLLQRMVAHGQRLPIDFFFRSLAQDQHERAISIVLSGTGSDGTLGVREVKGEGVPNSTAHQGWPEHYGMDNRHRLGE